MREPTACSPLCEERIAAHATRTTKATPKGPTIFVATAAYGAFDAANAFHGIIAVETKAEPT